MSGRVAFGLLGVGLLTDLLRALTVRSKVNRASVSSGYASDFTLCRISTGISTVIRICVFSSIHKLNNWTATIQSIKLKRAGKIIHME